MIILVGSQKGGCGKSTLAINIAAYLAKEGKDTMLVDADPQPTSANWCADRAENSDLPVVHCIQKYDNIRKTLMDLDQRYGFVIVDAQGRDSRELRTGMTAADILVIPFIPSQADLDTIPYLQEVITQAKDMNPELVVRGVLSKAPTNPSINEVAEARDYLREYPDIHVMNSVIRERKVYRDCLSEGVGVVEKTGNKAAAEIQLFMQELLNGY